MPRSFLELWTALWDLTTGQYFPQVLTNLASWDQLTSHTSDVGRFLITGKLQRPQWQPFSKGKSLCRMNGAVSKRAPPVCFGTLVGDTSTCSSKPFWKIRVTVLLPSEQPKTSLIKILMLPNQAPPHLHSQAASARVPNPIHAFEMKREIQPHLLPCMEHWLLSVSSMLTGFWAFSPLWPGFWEFPLKKHHLHRLPLGDTEQP